MQLQLIKQLIKVGHCVGHSVGSLALGCSIRLTPQGLKADKCCLSQRVEVNHVHPCCHQNMTSLRRFLSNQFRYWITQSSQDHI